MVRALVYLLVAPLMLLGLGGCESSIVRELLATPTPQLQSTPTLQETVERLAWLVPREERIPQGFRLQAGRYQTNERIIGLAPDPLAAQERVQRWGRVNGYVAVYAPAEPSPTAIQVAIDLFNTPQGAQGAFDAGPAVPPGGSLQPMEIEPIGDAARGFVLRDPEGDPFAHIVWFRYGHFLGAVYTFELGPDPVVATANFAKELLESIKAGLQ